MNETELKYHPVTHDHKAFLAKARTRKGFIEAYDALALEYLVAGQMLKALFFVARVQVWN